jgi:hypothetical protein
VSHAKTIDEHLSKSNFDAQDVRKVKDLFDNIKKVGVSEDEVLLIIDNAVKKNVDANRLLRLMVLISKTALAEISTKALMNKILEGFAKGAPVEVIIKEAENKVLHLKNAKAILNYLLLKGYETKHPDMAVNILSIYLIKGWEPSDLKREIESGGLKKKEFYELSRFLKSNN